MKRYIVVVSIDRNIGMLGSFASYEEAYEKMREDFIRIVNPDKEALENDGTDYDVWEFGKYSAWANDPPGGQIGEDYDWAILEIPA